MANWDHLSIDRCVRTERFNRTGGGRPHVRDVDRGTHGKKLLRSAEQAFAEFDHKATSMFPNDEELRATGAVVVLEGAESCYPLKIDSLTARSGGKRSEMKWMVLSVQEGHDSQPEKVTVWVSHRYRKEFLQLFEDYLTKESAKGKPKNNNLVANMSRIRNAFLQDLWTSDQEPDRDGPQWWEIWLDSQRFDAKQWDRFVIAFRLHERSWRMQFNIHVVAWIKAKWNDLENLPFSWVPVTEIRYPTLIDGVRDLCVAERTDYVQELSSRITCASEDAPAVCHLDTGVLRTHLLLKDSLSASDHHSILGGSGTDLHEGGHGTAMAGLALYGNLDPLFCGTDDILLHHRLESVRIFSEDNAKRLDPLDYGTATVQAVALPEIARPDRKRVFCLTLTARPDNPGEPTLWSSAVDALAVGTEIVQTEGEIKLLSAPQDDIKRLILAAAGNVNLYKDDYVANSRNHPIEDPAQSWNALTVGAYTNMTDVPSTPEYDNGWYAVATAGDISPHTRTSTGFDHNRWPIKPDICMEGGNTLSDGSGLCETRVKSLSLCSTGKASDVSLVSAEATSAATAQAARLAALIMSRYPDYWPETVRGLLTHSAEWTDTMKHRLEEKQSKGDRQSLLREFGWGVPTEYTVLNSNAHSVTLVVQDSFVPFQGERFMMPSLRLHQLPWPVEALRALGEQEVRLRVTLSYFIEPSASRRGWRNKYSYSSYGLRFDLQGSTETPDDFIRRVNRQANDEDRPSDSNNSQRWFLGEQARSRGSLHQDDWLGAGVELAHCKNIAVYPVGGWWKNNNRKDRRDLAVRYALIVSLKTSEQGVDLYTPIANQLSIPVETWVSTPISI